MPNCVKRADTSIGLIVFSGGLYHSRVYSIVTVLLHKSRTIKVALGPHILYIYSAISISNVLSITPAIIPFARHEIGTRTKAIYLSVTNSCRTRYTYCNIYKTELYIQIKSYMYLSYTLDIYEAIALDG
jgi:hypothetical protein